VRALARGVVAAREGYHGVRHRRRHRIGVIMGIKLRVVLNGKGTGPMMGMELGRIRIVAVHCSGTHSERSTQGRYQTKDDVEYTLPSRQQSLSQEQLNIVANGGSTAPFILCFNGKTVSSPGSRRPARKTGDEGRRTNGRPWNEPQGPLCTLHNHHQEPDRHLVSGKWVHGVLHADTKPQIVTGTKLARAHCVGVGLFFFFLYPPLPIFRRFLRGLGQNVMIQATSA
jgi:hypothetical protein